MGTTILLRPDLRRYGIAGMSVVLAILAVFALRPWMGQNISPVLLAPWVVLGAWYGGLGAGLVSTALNALAAAYFLIPPIYSFRIADRSDWVHLAMFALQGVLISWLCESRRRAVAGRTLAQRDAQQSRADARASSHALAQANLDLKHVTNALTESDLQRVSLFAQSLRRYARLPGTLRRADSIDVLRLIVQAMAEFRDEIRETDAEVTSDLGATRIEGDEAQLLEVFLNLIGNAIKFRSAEPLRIRIASEQRNGQCLFSISDNGIGIVPAGWDAAFALGSRMHGDRYPGAGMGLPIAKRIVENHGGQIWLNSEFGRGTTVRFSIPVGQGHALPMHRL